MESQELLRFHGISLDSKEFLPTPKASNSFGLQQMMNWARRGAWHVGPRPPVFKNHLRIPRNFFRFQEISSSSKKFLRSPRNFFEIQEIPVDSPGFHRFMPFPPLYYSLPQTFHKQISKTTQNPSANSPQILRKSPPRTLWAPGGIQFRAHWVPTK